MRTATSRWAPLAVGQWPSDAWPAQPLADKPVLLLQRFGGDGTFPVYGEFEGNHLKAVLIDFEPDEEEG